MGGIDSMTNSELKLENEGEECICPRCHWWNGILGMCNAYEPATKITFLPTTTSHCAFIPEERWKQRPKEYQERDLAAREERSKRYWAKREEVEMKEKNKKEKGWLLDDSDAENQYPPKKKNKKRE